MHNFLDSHLFIEFYFNTKDTLCLLEHSAKNVSNAMLCERYDVFPGCEDIAEELARYIQSFKNTVKRFTIDVNDSFIKRVNIEFDDNMSDEGQYSIDETVVDGDGNFAEIKIYIKRSVVNNGLLNTVLIHELQHAYQDYCLRKKGSSLSSKMREYSNNLNAGLDSENEWIYKISNIFYLLNHFEKDAYISQFKAELNKYSDRHFTSYEEIEKVLKDTQVYKNYVEVGEWVYQLNNNCKPENKPGVLGYINKKVNLNFKTYHSFLKWLNYRYRKVMSKAEKTIANLAKDCIKHGGLLPNPRISPTEYRKLHPESTEVKIEERYTKTIKK